VTRVFTTPHFQTAFDQVVEPLVLPGELSSGQARELTAIDHMGRGVAAIGRFVASPSLLGVKVRPTGRPVRVTAHLSFDGMAVDWWTERVPPLAPLDEAGMPRLLLVRSQGKTRGAVLMVRQAADSGGAVVTFDLQPEELTAEGLFVLEVVSIDNGRPSWAPAASLGSIGVLLQRIEFTEVVGDREIGLVSTGNLPVEPQSSTFPVRGGYFVANPADEPRRWIARASLAEPPTPRIKIEPAPEPEPEPVPVVNRPSTARILKRRAKRAARWVVPVAAVPVARRTAKRAAALKRRVLRAAKARRSPAPPPPPPPNPVVPAGPPPNPLAAAMANLVSRNLVQVELVGVEPGPTPGVQVRAREDAEIEIVTDGPLAVPALVRLSIEPSVVRELLDIEDGTVRWDLTVRVEP
jgi:hypothetical protein